MRGAAKPAVDTITWSGRACDGLSAERQRIYVLLNQIDDLQRRSETDFEAALREINNSSVESVRCADIAGVTLIDASGATTPSNRSASGSSVAAHSRRPRSSPLGIHRHGR